MCSTIREFRLKESRQGKRSRDRPTPTLHLSLVEAHHSRQGRDAAAAAAWQRWPEGLGRSGESICICSDMSSCTV